jgi:hypothetical protein
MTTENIGLKVVGKPDEGQDQAWDETVSYSALVRDQRHLQAEETEITEVQIRRTRAKEYIQVAKGDPGEACILWEGRKAWMVRPDLALQIKGPIEFCHLYLAVNEDGEVFFLPLKDSRLHEGSPGDESRQRAIRLARETWVRCEWGQKFRYRIFVPKDASLKGDPAWPSLSTLELIKIAKKDRWIDSPIHPLLLKAAEMEISNNDD